jgi:hypothetical protein
VNWRGKEAEALLAFLQMQREYHGARLEERALA